MRSTFAAAAALLLLIMPASARASLRDCHIQATNTATISSARDMSCERAVHRNKAFRFEFRD